MWGWYAGVGCHSAPKLRWGWLAGWQQVRQRQGCSGVHPCSWLAAKACPSRVCMNGHGPRRGCAAHATDSSWGSTSMARSAARPTSQAARSVRLAPHGAAPALRVGCCNAPVAAAGSAQRAVKANLQARTGAGRGRRRRRGVGGFGGRKGGADSYRDWHLQRGAGQLRKPGVRCKKLVACSHSQRLPFSCVCKA